MLGRIDFPQFLDADAVGLRILAGVELEALDHLLAQVAAAAFGEDGVLGMQFHAELEVLGGLAFLVDAHVAGGHALDGAVFVEQHFGSGEAGEDFHFQRFGLLRQPARQVGQADDVVAVVVKALGQHEVGHAAGTFFRQLQEGVSHHGLVQGSTLFLPVGDQLVQGARIEGGAGQDVRAGLGTFFEHDDGHIGAFFCSQLLQADGSGQAGRSAAHDHHVVFHGFARAVLFEDLLRGHG